MPDEKNRTSSFALKWKKAIKEFARSKSKVGSKELNAFTSLLYYHTGKYNNSKSFSDLKIFLDKLDEERGIPPGKGNRLFYLSTPPSVFSEVIAMLGQTDHVANHKDKTRWTRVIIEKTFWKRSENRSHFK